MAGAGYEKKIKEGYGSKVLKIVEASKDRIKPQCPYYEKCGSCHLMHMQYDAQLKLKKQMILESYFQKTKGN